MNVLPRKFLRQGLRVIVKQVASGQDTIDVLAKVSAFMATMMSTPSRLPR